MKERKTYVILVDVRSRHNVGSIFRTADGAGVSKIYLCGYTPAPVDRFGRVVDEIKKTSLGATESVRWEGECNALEVVKNLKEEGVKIVAVEQHPRAIPYVDFASQGDVAYIFGNERDGVSDELCELADVVVELPMRGEKESLNVSVTAGIALYRGLE